MPRPRKSGLPKETEEKLRVDALLDVAAEIFLESGFQGASTTEIARRAHASKRAFYARFPTKEKLFLAVIDRRMMRMTELFGAFLDDNAPLRETLLKIAHHFYNVVLGRENVALLRIIYMESLHFPEIGQAFVRFGPERGITRFSEFLSNQMKTGMLKAEDSRIAAEHFLGLIHGQSLQRALMGLPLSSSKGELETRIVKSVDAFLILYARDRVIERPDRGTLVLKRAVPS